MKANKLLNLFETKYKMTSTESYISYVTSIPHLGNDYKCIIKVSRHKPSFSKEIEHWVNKPIHTKQFTASWFDVRDAFDDILWRRDGGKYIIHETLLEVIIFKNSLQDILKDDYVHLYNTSRIETTPDTEWQINSIDKDLVDVVYRFLKVQLKTMDDKDLVELPKNVKPKVDIE